jgi:putative SOS response-associated peptidase YedK
MGPYTVAAMCGRYSSSSSTKDLTRIFDVDEVRTDDLPPRYNVAPTMPVYAVALSRTDRETGRKRPLHRVLGTFQWGLVPSWAKDPKVGNRMINARAETLASKPAYRRAFASHRTTLVPAYPVGRDHPPQRRQGNVCSLLRSV